MNMLALLTLFSAGLFSVSARRDRGSSVSSSRGIGVASKDEIVHHQPQPEQCRNPIPKLSLKLMLTPDNLLHSIQYASSRCSLSSIK
jgi:hypothetical protein